MNRSHRSAIAAACLTLATGPALAEDGGSHGFTPKKSEYAAGPKAKEQGHGEWGYSGKLGPEQWGDLSPAFALCKSGATQSPVDFDETFPGGTVGMELDYDVTELAIENNGHTLKVSYPAGSHMKVGGKEYQLLQFHFHAPSEHTENGRHHDMEIHFVHRGEDGKLAVIGVFVDQGGENLALREIWDHLPAQAGKKEEVGREIINARDLIPHGSGYYRYMGSLTTPPCSEGVNWFVMKQPVSASQEQIEQFRRIMHGNNRPPQPLNNRLIVETR